jgi:NAD+ diphosphatase
MIGAVCYTGCRLDRAAHRRTDAAWLADRLANPSTRVVPLWRGRAPIADGRSAAVVSLTGERAAAVLAAAEDVVFLGQSDDGPACFAADVSGLAGERLPALENGARFLDLRRVGARLASTDGALLAYARALLHWHRRHRFCGRCGAATASRDGGHMRACGSAGCGEKLFPRIDPVVLMLVTRRGDGGADECLLARQRDWPRGLVSGLAGFVEPGEAAEEAVVREVREEAGLTVTGVRYVGSQPWPFPHSLMLGFRAEVDPGAAIRCTEDELEDAGWFSREAVAAIETRGLKLPFRGTIARALIDDWLAGPGDGRHAPVPPPC